MSLLSTYREEGKAHATSLPEVLSDTPNIFTNLLQDMPLVDFTQASLSNVVVFDTSIPGSLKFLLVTRRNNANSTTVLKITLDGVVIYNYSTVTGDSIAHNPVGLFSEPAAGGFVFSLEDLEYNTLKVEVHTASSSATCHTFYRLVEK